MKAIIDGKRYNTETATEIASDDGGNGRSDFRWFAESLYRTPRGAFFLAGEGGPMTKYAKTVGNGRTDGRGIIPLSAVEAREWLEAAGFEASIERYFADQIEDA